MSAASQAVTLTTSVVLMDIAIQGLVLAQVGPLETYFGAGVGKGSHSSTLISIKGW